MVFDVSGEAYDRFMGRYSQHLAPLFADFVGVEAGQRALDVGCGPGALTSELVRRLGPEQVVAVDPSPRFVAVIRERLPGVEVHEGRGEALPHPDDSFDAALSQLAVTFMEDAPQAARELRRVVRPGGTVALCMWDLAMPLFAVLWGALHAVDPSLPAQGARRGFRDPESLYGLLQDAGLGAVETTPLDVEGAYESFGDFWDALLIGAGPIGDTARRLGPQQLAALEPECRARLGNPEGAFALAARAWAVRGRV